MKKEAEPKRLRRFSAYPPGKNTKGVAKGPNDKNIVWMSHLNRRQELFSKQWKNDPEGNQRWSGLHSQFHSARPEGRVVSEEKKLVPAGLWNTLSSTISP